MHQLPVTIEEAQELVHTHPAMHESLRTLLKYSIANKSLPFSKADFAKDYDNLKNHPLLVNENANRFQLNYENITLLLVLTPIAEEMLGEKAPDEPVAAICFTDKFCQLIRQPKLNHHWNSALELHFPAYLLIYLNQVKGVDITRFVGGVTPEMKEELNYMRSADLTYTHVFPYLTDTTAQEYEKVCTLLANPRSRNSTNHMLQECGKINGDKAEKLYHFSLSKPIRDDEYLLANLVIGLYPRNEDHYFNEALGLFRLNALHGLITLTWLNYSSADQISRAFALITQQEITAIEYLRDAPTFFIRLIENKHTPVPIVEQCFEKIKASTKNEDEQLRGNLLRGTRMIKGYDKEKYDLLPDFMSWGNPQVLQEYFSQFTSPLELFDLVRHSFLAHQLNTDIGLLSNALDTQYMLHQSVFEKELAKLLSDDLAILRFAGLQVLGSRYGGIFTIDFTDLNEQEQPRIIDTLLSSPVNIEEILPMALAFRKSPYPSVIKHLERQLGELVRAYEQHLVEMASNVLDMSVKTDKKIFQALKKAYDVYKKELDAKGSIKELDPFENEGAALEFFYRLEQEIQTENIEKAQAGSFLAQIAKTTTIIRGSGYNTELNPAISMLQQVAVSRLMDRRYYANPDKYEWRFKMIALGTNYTPKTDQ